MDSIGGRRIFKEEREVWEMVIGSKGGLLGFG